MIKKITELKLKWFAKRILKKYNPEIIGITGSVGKTSTKEAVYTVLKDKFRVRRNRKNYNNEIGLPLTIINADSPGKNLFSWLWVFLKAAKLLLFKDRNYPRVLVLEMGVDRPGDMDYLLRIVKPQIGVLTFVGTVHAEYFSSRNELRIEKTKLISCISKQGYSIINFDNKEARQAQKTSQATVISYGLDKKAIVRAHEISFSIDSKSNELNGLSFNLVYQNKKTKIILPQVLGIGAVYSALAAAAVGIAKGMNPQEIQRVLKGYISPKGRMRVIEGIKHTTILDDSYNSEPASARAALGTLKRVPAQKGARKLAALGDMLELGNYSEAGHRDVGKYAFKCGVDRLIVVGERARDIARGAKEAGMREEQIFNFPDSSAAGRFIQDRLKENDIILVKGSQGIRMEKIVVELMAEPLRAEELVVRQEKKWRNK